MSSPTVKSCMKRSVSQSDLPSLDSSSLRPRRPSIEMQRKSVSFCPADVEVFYVENWDRSPAEVTNKLHYSVDLASLQRRSGTHAAPHRFTEDRRSESVTVESRCSCYSSTTVQIVCCILFRTVIVHLLIALNRLYWGALGSAMRGLVRVTEILLRSRPYQKPTPTPPKLPEKPKILRENIYTIPNLLTVSRILACPVLGWSILHGDFKLATSLLAYAGLTDLVDGYLARRFKMGSVLGTILDPAADKTLMTTLTITLAMKGMIPVPLVVIILGRDVLLSISAFYIRYTSLPEPKTWTRYWDFSIPSAEVHPTGISKPLTGNAQINTAVQLLLMGTTTVSPVLPFDIGLALTALQWTVAITTVWSGLSYLFTKNAVRIISPNRKPPAPPS
ncbi:hypothetical protein CERSUDRAFT_122483 [Gelatoporia subvermispora B]|uniref:CDP-alcohol phosphatidyltransferase n=1 Tax=Ceriporiopsis subvermispora (strain B) TaxID=914234 RepID=M2PQX1_CERS8|nr:hypothetical protein CERSUDRAFT_122483 [Gelatoporia subvermispora B]